MVWKQKKTRLESAWDTGKEEKTEVKWHEVYIITKKWKKYFSIFKKMEKWTKKIITNCFKDKYT